MDGTPVDRRRRYERVTAACNLCKLRKVKCDGLKPCAYCRRRNYPEACEYSAPRQRSYARTPRASSQHITNASEDSRQINREGGASATPELVSATGSHKGEEDTIVPREARLLCDAQGKLIFIGDSAPLSFLQTVRHLITSRVDPDGFAAPTSRDSMFEHVPTKATSSGNIELTVDPKSIPSLVSEYLSSTSGLIDLFDPMELDGHFHEWAELPVKPHDVTSAVYFLVIAIGSQESDPGHAEIYFNHAKNLMLAGLCGNMNITTIRGFTLLSMYLLRAFQPNGSFLYFALAARTAYSIGIHRTEVNAHFGSVMHGLRDRIWKSIRILDLFLSSSLGRPPATSDVDCTVSYGSHDRDSSAENDILDASVQVFLIIERIIVEIYSRKEISVHLAESISHQLKDWSSRWLHTLISHTNSSDQVTDGQSQRSVVGTCQVLCSYYYGVMLLTRPFLIYELHAYLSATMTPPGLHENSETKLNKASVKSTFAYAALDAAILFVDLVERLIDSGQLRCRMPLIVSWLFTTSLVLGLALLGKSGRSLEKHARASVKCLQHFATKDPHAHQYRLIADSLLKTSLHHVEKMTMHEQRMRTQISSQIFGLLPAVSQEALDFDHSPGTLSTGVHVHEGAIGDGLDGSRLVDNLSSTDWTQLDTDIFPLPGDFSHISSSDPSRSLQDGGEDPLGDLPLFPVFDTMETFDLGNMNHIL